MGKADDLMVIVRGQCLVTLIEISQRILQVVDTDQQKVTVLRDDKIGIKIAVYPIRRKTAAQQRNEMEYPLLHFAIEPAKRCRRLTSSAVSVEAGHEKQLASEALDSRVDI